MNIKCLFKIQSKIFRTCPTVKNNNGLEHSLFSLQEVTMFSVNCSCCTHTEQYSNLLLHSFFLLLCCRRCCYSLFTSFPLFPLSLSSCPLSNRESQQGRALPLPSTEEQLECKPAKLTPSPWDSHTHYSNQSLLDHPDTLDIWVSVSSLLSPSVSPPPFFKIFLLSISVGSSFSQMPL